MVLRAYRPEDAAVICSWIRSEEELYRWSADRFNRFPLTGADVNGQYAQQAATGRFFPLMAADEDGRLLGHFIIRYPREDDDDTVRFGFVIVNPAMRGRGCGSGMLRLGVQYVREHLHASRIDLGVFAGNENARRCYEAVGFREYGRRDCAMPIGTWECIDMELFVD
ncbi:MAG: GNAT family N-acetyltransferase [Clostridia bacterium]|nr:GNAT family N-acetyltransferase [Clostridia bacterium]